MKNLVLPLCVMKDVNFVGNISNNTRISVINGFKYSREELLLKMEGKQMVYGLILPQIDTIEDRGLIHLLKSINDPYNEGDYILCEPESYCELDVLIIVIRYSNKVMSPRFTEIRNIAGTPSLSRTMSVIEHLMSNYNKMFYSPQNSHILELFRILAEDKLVDGQLHMRIFVDGLINK